MSLADLIKKGGLRRPATATVATLATVSPDISPSVATVATVAVAKAPDRAANDPAPDPDRHCWPHSPAMNTAEIDTFTARLARFIDKGLNLEEGAALADKLVVRDRESNDHRVCLECTYLVQGWRCNNWRVASAGFGSRRAPLAAELVLQLQRCDGFHESG